MSEYISTLKRAIWNFHCTFWPAQAKFRRRACSGSKISPRLISNSEKRKIRRKKKLRKNSRVFFFLFFFWNKKEIPGFGFVHSIDFITIQEFPFLYSQPPSVVEHLILNWSISVICVQLASPSSLTYAFVVPGRHITFFLKINNIQ